MVGYRYGTEQNGVEYAQILLIVSILMSFLEKHITGTGSIFK